MSAVMPYKLKGLLPESILKQSVGLVGGIDFVPFGCYPKATQVRYVNTWLVLPEDKRAIWANVQECVRRKRAVEAGEVHRRHEMPEYCVALATSTAQLTVEEAIEQTYSMLDSEQCANSGLVFFAYGTRVKRVIAGCCINWARPKESVRRLRIVVPLFADFPPSVLACFQSGTEKNFITQWFKGLCLLWAMSNPCTENIFYLFQAMGTKALVEGTAAMQVYSDYSEIMDECQAEVLECAQFPSFMRMEKLMTFILNAQMHFTKNYKLQRLKSPSGNVVKKRDGGQNWLS